MLVKASAPGSLMLLGEYAVLHGKQALVCAIDKRISVTLSTRTDKTLRITSQLGELEIELSQLQITPPFQFVTAVIKKFQKEIKSGCDIAIESEFSEQLGLGSSAAVTVAVLATVMTWLNLTFTAEQLIQEARAVILEVQGVGSGADVAACVLGGIVAYKTQPMLAEKISHQYPITAVYAGYKTPTVQAIKQVTTAFAAQPNIFEKICQDIDACAIAGAQSARDQDWQALGQIMNTQQNLMESLGVNTPELSEIIAVLRTDKNIIGAKISGSGLGDCIIGLGKTEQLKFSNEKIRLVPVAMTTEGVRYEKI